MYKAKFRYIKLTKKKELNPKIARELVRFQQLL